MTVGREPADTVERVTRTMQVEQKTSDKNYVVGFTMEV